MGCSCTTATKFANNFPYVKKEFAVSDIIKNKPSEARVAFTERVKRIGYGVAAFFVIASTGIVDEEPELTYEDREQARQRYLEDQGCDKTEYLQGGVPFCPEAQTDEESTVQEVSATLPEEEPSDEAMSTELTGP